jgi:hypothetical protein
MEHRIEYLSPLLGVYLIREHSASHVNTDGTNFLRAFYVLYGQTVAIDSHS